MTERILTSSYWKAEHPYAIPSRIGTYHKGYYYVFAFKNDIDKIYYWKSQDGENWTEHSGFDTNSKSYLAILTNEDNIWVFFAYGSSFQVRKATQNDDGTLSFGSAVTIGSVNSNYITIIGACWTTNRMYAWSINYDGNYKVKIYYSSDNGSTWTNILSGDSNLDGGGYAPSVSCIKYEESGDDAILLVAGKYSSYFRWRIYDGSSWGSWYTDEACSDYGPVGVGKFNGNYYWFQGEKGVTKTRVKQKSGDSWTTKKEWNFYSYGFEHEAGNVSIWFVYDFTDSQAKVLKTTDYNAWETLYTKNNYRPKPLRKASQVYVILESSEEDKLIFEDEAIYSFGLSHSVSETLSLSSSLSRSDWKNIFSFLNLEEIIYFPKSWSKTLEELLSLTSSVIGGYLKEVLRQEFANLADKIIKKRPLHQILSLVDVYYPGWLSGWQYRKPLNISSVEGAGKNYPIRIKVHYGIGTDSDDDVYLGKHCRKDFGDIRFTDKYGSTLLDYWMETKVNSDYAIFWVEIPDDLSAKDAKIYLYYGNWNATTTQDNLGLDLWQLREYDPYSSYNPDFLFNKPESSVLRLDSYTNGASSLGRGFLFIQAKRAYLHGKKLKIHWKAYFSASTTPILGSVYIVDNPHLRTKTTEEFADNDDTEHPLNDYTNIQVLSIEAKGSAGWTNWTTSTSSVLDLSDFVSDYVTILIRLIDSWTGQTVMLDVDYLQILDSSDNILKIFDFTESVDMEQTGTTRDYGLYRKKVSPEPTKTWGSTEHIGPYLEQYFESIQFLSTSLKTSILSLKEAFNLLATFVKAVEILQVFEALALSSVKFLKTKIERTESLLLSSLFYIPIRIKETIDLLSALLPFEMQKICSETLGDWLIGSSWLGKAKIILKPSQEIENYILRVRVQRGLGINSNYTIYDQNLARSDFASVRFQLENSFDILKVFADKETSSYRDFFIKISKLTNPTRINVFMGNPNVSSAQTDTEIFPFCEIFDSYTTGEENPNDWILRRSNVDYEKGEVVDSGFRGKAYQLFANDYQQAERVPTLLHSLPINLSEKYKVRFVVKPSVYYQSWSVSIGSSLIVFRAIYSDNSVKSLGYRVRSLNTPLDKYRFNSTIYSVDHVIDLGNFDSWTRIERNLTEDWTNAGFSTENINSISIALVTTAKAGYHGGCTYQNWTKLIVDEIILWKASEISIQDSYFQTRQREILEKKGSHPIHEIFSMTGLLSLKPLFKEALELTSQTYHRVLKTFPEVSLLSTQVSKFLAHGWLFSETLSLIDSKVFSFSKSFVEALTLKGEKGVPYSRSFEEFLSIISTFLRKKIPSIYLIVRKRRLPWGTYFGWTPPFYRSDFLRKVLLYGFMDSSTTPWSYKVIAYEPETNTWFGPYYIADSATDDAHWTPSLGALPDGRLVIMWGYDGEMKYRISTYSLKEEIDIEKVLTNWGSTQTLTTDTSAYPRFMMWPDKTLLFKRYGSACNGYPEWWEWDPDQEKFVSKGKFCDVSTCYEYPKFVKIGDKILATWLNYTSCGVGNKKNVYFAYSPDKGNTWKKYDGTTITPPFSASETLVKETPYDYTPTSVYLDYNDRPIIVVQNRNNLEYLKTFTGERWICYYTKPLGESGGEWKLEPLRISVGHLNKSATFFRDEESSCLGFYSIDPGNNIFGKFLEAGGEEHVWLRVKNIESSVLISDGTTFDDTIYPFEQLVTLRTKLMGKVEKGQTSFNPESTIYASKFIPFRNGTITRIQVYIYTENDNYKVKVGIFDENWNLLGSSSWQEACSTNAAYEGFTYNGRLPPIEVEGGKIYYVACQCESGSYTRKIYRDSDLGGEIYSVGSWTNNPSKTLRYSNQSLTIVAEEDVPYFMGTGGITFFRTFQEGISFKEWWNTIFQTVLEFIQFLDSFSPRFIRSLEELFNLVSTKALVFRTYKNEWVSLAGKFLPIFTFKESLNLLGAPFFRTLKRLFESSIFFDIIQKKLDKSIHEIIEYSDKFLKILSKIQFLFESVSFIDQFSKMFKFTLFETSNLQESLKKRVFAIKEEIVIILEFLGKIGKSIRHEIFMISETIFKKAIAIQEESLKLVSEKLFRALKQLSEEITFLDLFAKIWSKGIQEILSITEVVLKKAIKAFQGSVHLKGQKSLLIKKSLSKTLNFVESLLLSQLLRFYQTLNLTDESFYSLTKTLSEKITLSKVFLIKIAKTLSAKLSLLDIVSRKIPVLEASLEETIFLVSVFVR